MSKLTASQDISQFLASADKVEAADILEAIKTENLLNQTLIIQADDTVKGYVGNIGDEAFDNQTTLKGLSLGSSVTIIGDYAFNLCSGLIGALNIPNAVTSIGIYAFNNCLGFTGPLTIGNSVNSIGNYAFQNCSGFTGININRAVAPTIGSDVFYGMSSVSPAVIHVPVGATGYAASYNGLTIVKDL